MSHRLKLLLLFVLFVLLAAALNFPAAMILDVAPRQSNREPNIINIIGPGVPESWPARTPHAQPWPPMRQYSVHGRPGYHVYSGWAAKVGPDGGGTTTHYMQAERVGWPFPVIERVQYGWPWDDPAWKISMEPDPKARILWSGMLGNPLAVGGGLWLAIFLPWWLVRFIRRRRRAKAHCCPKCGYPAGSSPVCTECGVQLPASVLASAAS